MSQRNGPLNEAPENRRHRVMERKLRLEVVRALSTPTATESTIRIRAMSVLLPLLHYPPFFSMDLGDRHQTRCDIWIITPRDHASHDWGMLQTMAQSRISYGTRRLYGCRESGPLPFLIKDVVDGMQRGWIVQAGPGGCAVRAIHKAEDSASLAHVQKIGNRFGAMFLREMDGPWYLLGLPQVQRGLVFVGHPMDVDDELIELYMGPSLQQDLIRAWNNEVGNLNTDFPAILPDQQSADSKYGWMTWSRMAPPHDPNYRRFQSLEGSWGIRFPRLCPLTWIDPGHGA